MKGRTTAFFRSSWAELKKVHWPSRKEIITYTAVVLVSVAFVSLLIWFADSILSFVLEYLFKMTGKG
ncbi:MAG: preprotein translocase subunit SecE [Firmicutes bacterium]|nr:preprotein translocase subunit SecE [Bacillota bacterium]